MLNVGILKRIFKFFFFFVLLFFILGLACFFIIEKTTENQLTYNIEKVKPCKAGLVLGTSQFLKSGYHNLYFAYRIDAAEKLFKSGKIQYLLLSGDNRKAVE